MADLLIFPWLCTRDPFQRSRIVVGPWELRAVDDHTIAELPPDAQVAARRLMAFYRTPSGGPIRHCTLAKRVEEGWLQPIQDEHNWQRLQAVVCFSGLSKRRFFNEGMGYCTSHDFDALLWFNVEKEGGFTYTHRRKDGAVLGYETSGERCGLRYPGLHHSGIRLDFDDHLADACMRALEDPDRGNADLEESLVHFNLANFDAPTTPPHVELQLIKGALERLVGMAGGADRNKSFVIALQDLRRTCVTSDTELPLHRRSFTLPAYCSGTFGAWAWDLHDSRGDLAHGRTRTRNARCWGIEEHVRLGCYMFPLLVRAWLCREGYLDPHESRPCELGAFDRLAHLRDQSERENEHEVRWATLVREAAEKDLSSKILHRAMRRIEILGRPDKPERELER